MTTAQFVSKKNAVRVIPETKENILEKALKEYWMFKENPKILNMIVEYVDKGLISVDISNLQAETWDGHLRIKINDASAYAILNLVSPMVTNCRPDDMRMISHDIIQFWWD